MTASQATADLPAAVWFRLTLGGITGHKDFARETGVLVAPDECVAVAADAILGLHPPRRPDRPQEGPAEVPARRLGLREVPRRDGEGTRPAAAARLARPLGAAGRSGPLGARRRPSAGAAGSVLRRRRAAGRPADGRAAPRPRPHRRPLRQRRRAADRLAEPADSRRRRGRRRRRAGAIESLGLDWRASSFRSGLVACTGAAGCKFAAADTKRHALLLADYLEERLELDVPINLHLTGCHNSCAQHYIGDVGLQGVKVEVGDETVEGYHLCVGGGYADRQGIGRTLFESLPFEEIPAARRTAAAVLSRPPVRPGRSRSRSSRGGTRSRSCAKPCGATRSCDAWRPLIKPTGPPVGFAH